MHAVAAAAATAARSPTTIIKTDDGYKALIKQELQQCFHAEFVDVWMEKHKKQPPVRCYRRMLEKVRNMSMHPDLFFACWSDELDEEEEMKAQQKNAEEKKAQQKKQERAASEQA